MKQQVRFRDGFFIDSDITARFAYVPTTDGKISYWGFRPTQMSDEEAENCLLASIAELGLEIAENPHPYTED